MELERVAELFAKRSPLLVEVRFPRMGTSSDWYLFEEKEEFEELWKRLPHGVELHLASVWDIESPRDKVGIVR